MGGVKENLIGEKFGKLTVIAEEKEPEIRRTQGIWICKCECGNIKHYNTGILKHRSSCGCSKTKLLFGENNPTYRHGATKTKLFSIWRGMKKRCYQPKCNGYHNYGGRGIEVCEEWKNDFIKFKEWAEAHGYSEELSLDRIDVDGNYEPSNCKWSTHEEQDNNKRNSKKFIYNGDYFTLPQFCRKYGLNINTVESRAYRHKDWPIEKILFLNDNKNHVNQFG